MSYVLLGDVYAAKRLVQLFSYTSRLSLRHIDLTQQCLDDYMATEKRFDYFSDLPLHIISSLNLIIKRWMSSFDPTRIRFRHGPGGVAGHGRTSIEYKYKDLSYDRLLTYAFGDPWWSNGSIRSNLDRISQTIFVPKSYKTFRTISMESSTLQYCQQGIWREIDRVVSQSGFLRNRIGFHDQTRNQRLAREGSISRNYATIDLSAASDSVSYALVKALFRGTKLLRYIVATRSKRTLLPDGRLICLKKFAPMGSSLCFPIETIIFAAICYYVTRGHNVTGDFSVFGDDIIIPTQCVGQVMTLLETLGFRVNREKSFYRTDCWFRESCGGEYVDGFDVTPLRVSRKYSHEDKDVRLVSLIALANDAYKRGFLNLRSFFLRRLRDLRFKALFGPTSVLSDSYTNYHLRRRWNVKLYRTECKATRITTKFGWEFVAKDYTFRGKTCHNRQGFPPECSDEVIRYRHWLESTQKRIFVFDGFESRTSKPVVSIEHCWMATPAEKPDQLFSW
jgi:hypothetical protein